MNSIEGQEKFEPELNPLIQQQQPEISSPKPNKPKENTRKKAKSENSEDERKNNIFQLMYEYKDRSQIEKIEKSLNQGINANLQNAEGKSLLMIACENGSLDIVQLLLNKNADINKKDKNGKTALHYAMDSKTENLEIVQSLLDLDASLTAETNDKCTVLHKAIDKGYISIARELLQREQMANMVNAAIESTGDTPLHIAVRKNDLNAIKLLFEHGCDLSRKNKQKKTPLDYAINNPKLAEELKLLDSKQKDKNDNQIQKFIETTSKTPEIKSEEDSFQDLVNHIDKDTKKKNNPPRNKINPSQEGLNEEENIKIDSPKKPPKNDKRENSNTNKQENQNNRNKEDNQKNQAKKKKNEGANNNQNHRPYTEGSQNSTTSQDTAETLSNIQSPPKNKNQKFNNQINQNQTIPFNQNFNNPNINYNMQQNSNFQNNFPNSPQQTFINSQNQNVQGKKKPKNANFNLQQQQSPNQMQQFQNNHFMNDSKSNPQTPTQKPNTNFQNIQLNRQFSDGYQNQPKGFNNGPQQQNGGKGNKGQGKNKNQQMQNSNPNFHGMMDMNPMNQAVKMMNQNFMDDPKQKQNINIPMMGQPYYDINQNQYYNMNMNVRLGNTIQNSVIVNFPQPFNNGMFMPPQYMYGGFPNPQMMMSPEQNNQSKNILHFNLNDPNFLNEMHVKDSTETLNQKNKELSTCIEQRNLEIMELNTWVTATKSNVIKLKDILKEHEAKIQELTKKNQELENKLKGFKAGQGIQIETQDREVLTEFIFDDILQPEGTILDQKINQDTWKYSTVPGILNEEILEFEKQVSMMNQDKKPLFDSLINLIKEAVNEAVPGSECSIYGSFSTGLSLNWSDIDLVIKIPHGNTHTYLEYIGNVLQSKKFVEEVKHIRNTTVPVLKITCINNYLNKKVDISIQESRHNGLACVELVKDYLETYPSLKYLILILKQFLFHLNLNDTYSGGLSSYGLILMIVFLFQTQEEQAAKSQDLKNIGHLLLAFLKFYGIDYDYVNYFYVNPKTIKNKDNSEYNWMMNYMNQQPSYMDPKIFIQDPLSNNNNVGRSTFQIKEIKNAFTAAYFEAYKQCPCGIHKNLDPNFSKTKKCGSLLLRMFKAYQPQK